MTASRNGDARGSEEVSAPSATAPGAEISITVTKDGPYRVRGSVPISVRRVAPDANGESVDWEEGPAIDAPDGYDLCRCGQSSTKPFCDGTHLKIGFKGEETASREPYVDRAFEVDGREVILTDAEDLCSFARFCDRGDRVWNLVQSDSETEVSLGVQEAQRCPSGRLVVWQRENLTPIEPPLEPSIGLVQDPALGVSGPLWARGGIPVVSEDGFRYEVRNRVTLCRCGASENKPFCDGSHARIGFRDGLDAEVSDADEITPSHRD
ncbi:MAG: CDGSH iron-sulfur domain-containing protein [Actinomycetota bacterium]